MKDAPAPVLLAAGNPSVAPTRKRRLVFCIDNLGVGGTELNALRTLERLDKSRYDARLVCLKEDGPLLDRFRSVGTPITFLRLGSSLHSPSTLAAIRSLATRFVEWGPEVVHCHDRYSNFVGSLAGRMAGVPLVLASKRWTETTWQHRLVGMVAFRLAHVVLANSASTSVSINTQERIPMSRIRLVPNFVDDAAFTPPSKGWVTGRRRELGIPEESPVLGVVASLRPVKQHETILRAVPALVARFPLLRVVFAGTGPSQAPLADLAQSLNVARHVVFAGQVPHQPSMHWLFNVSALMSRSEGFPNSIIEAMAAARPVVASDVPGNRDAVVSGQSGLLVPVADSTAFARAVGSLLEDPLLCREMGARGSSVVRERFSAKRVVDLLESIYDAGPRA